MDDEERYTPQGNDAYGPWMKHQRKLIEAVGGELLREGDAGRTKETGVDSTIRYGGREFLVQLTVKRIDGDEGGAD